ncbi:hypothetical protein BDF21DRAFT_496908 [Thamnidium elegans]|uniref:THIF-type NAD/FAD binding fold domain-containing protein n=1 Tax=Thamnidium elegans TaxID=101142 RepID=A0A8H7SKA9_9FUNG|nr:hypothetical protein INT48_004079 [Thamnidium elegans]KAI8062999.1 hypothetical protein BDF21DRAFT_496908 [Thamnidium elegans]
MTALSNFTDYLERHPTATRLTLTAIAASALTATALLGYQSVTRPRLVTSKKTRAAVDLPTFVSIIDEESKEPVREKMDESLVLELLARNIAFFGEEGVTKIRNSFVVVLGAGAIGSWTALMLTRSGVEHIRIVDSGMVRLDTMSCNAVAKIADIGKSKATIMKKYIAEVAPNAQVEPVTTHFTLETMKDLLAGNPDYVVDTLPNIKDKVLLAKYCKENNIKIVSAMSAGVKADPTLMQMTDVSNSFTDPLARMYRRQLRKSGIDRGIPVVYSSEKSLHVGEKVPDFRTRSLPVLSPVASMFGMALVTYVVTQLAEFTAYTLPTSKMRDSVYIRLQKEVASKEEYVYGNTTETLSVTDIGYIFDEIWSGKSAISAAQDRMLVLTRWDKTKVGNFVNLILLTKEEAAIHDKLEDIVSFYGSETVERIEKQFALEKKLQELWVSSL